MVSLKVSNNSKRKVIIVSGSTTVAQAFEQAGISTAGATISLDGCVVRDTSLTLDQLGVSAEGSSLMATIKMDNAR